MLRVALTNLGKYNEGQLIYKWLSIPASEEEVKKAKDAIGINEEYEEWFITDYETDIEGLKVGEYEDLEALNELMEAYENLNVHEQEALQAILEVYSSDFEDAMGMIADGNYMFYSGMSLTDVAEELVDDGCFGDIPDAIQNYIDYEAIARDLRCDSYYEATTGVIRID